MTHTHVARATAVALLAAACSDDPTAPPVATARVVAVAPAPASRGVDPTKPVTITFSHAMRSGMEMLVTLHEGAVTGPTVAAVPAWSADGRTLTITPASALKSRTTYVVHLAPNLTTAAGGRVDHAACLQLGGRTVTGGMMGGGWPGMMGAGWQPVSGSYGMIFTFTTA